jgi:uncharacterized protein (DUF2062 family)
MTEGTSNSTHSKLRRGLRRAYNWVLGFHGSPSQVARGMAIGVFFAFTPPLGLQMIAAAILATLTYSNRAAAIAAVWITNPFTALPIYLTTYRLGRHFTPGYPGIDLKQRLPAVIVYEHGEWLNLAQQVRELTSLGAEILVPMFVGGFIVGLGLAVIAYVLTQLAIMFGKRYVHLPRGETDRR